MAKASFENCYTKWCNCRHPRLQVEYKEFYLRCMDCGGKHEWPKQTIPCTFKKYWNKPLIKEIDQNSPPKKQYLGILGIDLSNILIKGKLQFEDQTYEIGRLYVVSTNTGAQIAARLISIDLNKKVLAFSTDSNNPQIGITVNLFEALYLVKDDILQGELQSPYGKLGPNDYRPYNR